MIAVINYGVGNLFSLTCSLQDLGAEVVVTGDADTIRKADKIIFPGVGAFEDAIHKLRETGLDVVLKEEAAAGKPILGICLGMQLLFEKSYEFGEFEGLGLLPGAIVPLSGYIPDELKIPHMGWNSLCLTENGRTSPLFRYVEDGDFVYFVHSYWAQCDESVITSNTDYGAIVTASVARDNVMGVQFHPEKSGPVGLKMLKAFCEMEAR